MMHSEPVLLDFSQFESGTSIFTAVVGLLFASWFQHIDEKLAQKMPTHRRDRKPYIKSIVIALISKSLPLTFILFGYVYTFLGILFYIFANYRFAYNPFSSSISHQASIFFIIYLLIFYFLLISLNQTYKLLECLLAARKGKDDSLPKVSVP